MEVKERDLASKGNRKGKKRTTMFQTSPLPPETSIPTLKPVVCSPRSCTSPQPGLSSAEGEESFANAARRAVPQAQPTHMASVWGHQLAAPQSSQPASGQLFCHSPQQAAPWPQHPPRLTVTPQTPSEELI